MPHEVVVLLLPLHRQRSRGACARPGGCGRRRLMPRAQVGARDARAGTALPLRPDRERFGALVRSGQRIVPVWTAVVGDQLTPVGAFRAVVKDAPGFLLESVEGGERW